MSTGFTFIRKQESQRKLQTRVSERFQSAAKYDLEAGGCELFRKGRVDEYLPVNFWTFINLIVSIIPRNSDFSVASVTFRVEPT